MAPGKQCKLHAPLLPSATHGLLIGVIVLDCWNRICIETTQVMNYRCLNNHAIKMHD